MSPLEIRPAAPTEQSALFALHEELFRKEIEEIWDWDDASQLRNFSKEWAESETSVICHGGQLMGCVQYYIRPDHLYLFNLAIHPDFQNQGVGSEVITWLKAQARHRDLAIELQVFQTNLRVLNFYRRHGFEVVKKIETGFRLRWTLSLPEVVS